MVKVFKRVKLITCAAVLILHALVISLLPTQPAQALRPLIFPVIGPASFHNDYNAPRGDHIHHATDIIAGKRQKLVAVVDGTVTFVAYPQPSWGYAVFIEDDDGFVYRYLHINDDHPGTNDGQGGGMNAYAQDMNEGNRVTKGQLIGYVGDSGNSNGVSHLHFEMFKPNGDVTNPYDHLVAATRISEPRRYPALEDEVLPFGTGSSAKQDISIDMGNLDGDVGQEYVVGAGPGVGSRVILYNEAHAIIRSFYAYASNVKSGANVALGDVDNDNVDEIIVGPGAGAAPRVRVFEVNGTKIGDFLALSPNFKGGIRVASGDVDGDGIDEIITGAGKGGGPRVSVFELDGTPVDTFYAYSEDFKGGIDVASADVTGTAPDEIITGAGKTGGPRVNTFSLDGTQLASFNAYASTFKGGVRVSAGNLRLDTARAEILTIPASGGSPSLKMFAYGGGLLDNTFFFEEWWKGSYDVAAALDDSRASAGLNRRATVRDGLD